MTKNSYLLKIPTRWMDNDVYGHVNNVHYYSYFDTAVNRYLIETGALDIATSTVVGLVVETKCTYMKSLAFPETVTAEVSVSKIGNSSIRYEILLYGEGSHEPAAKGYFVHVYVDRESHRPVSLPDKLKTAVANIHIQKTQDS